MDEQTKQRLISELRDHLDALPETPESVDSEDESPGSREIDLYSLFTELAGLRNEIRLESRQLKRALDDFGGVFSTLKTTASVWAANSTPAAPARRRLPRKPSARCFWS